MNKKLKILLLGFGKYGEHIAKYLMQEHYDFHVADIDKTTLKKASKVGVENLFVFDIHDDDLITDMILDEDYNLVFCAFDDEETNVYLTITFKSLFRHLEVISICESKESERKLRLAGADKVIDTMEAAANRLYYILEKPAVAEAMDRILFKDKNIVFEEITVPKGSFLDGVNLKDINFKKLYNVLLIGIVDKELGNKFTFVTKGIDHKLDAGDILVIIGKKENVEKFQRLLTEKDLT